MGRGEEQGTVACLHKPFATMMILFLKTMCLHCIYFKKRM